MPIPVLDGLLAGNSVLSLPSQLLNGLLGGGASPLALPGQLLNSLLGGGNLLGGGLPVLPGSGATSPITITNTPDGANVEAVSLDLAGITGGVAFMDDGGMPPPVQLGGEAGEHNVGEGLGGRSIETIDLNGPLDLGLDALFSTNQSENTHSSTDIAGGLLTAQSGESVSPSSLESAGATGPLGIDLDLLMQNETGSGLASLVSVSNEEVLGGEVLDGPGGRIDTLSLQGPLEALIEMGPGANTGFPLEVGDDSLIGASLFDNLSNSDVETLDIGFGSILGGQGPELGGLDGVLDGLFS
jgi:hypothetical protein